MTEHPPEDPSAAVSERISDTVAHRLLQQRILVLDSELDERIGTRMVSQLIMLAAEDPATDIALWIHSPGGSVPAMLAIADTMQLISNDIRTCALGVAASAGQFLLSAGTPGKRYALPHAKILMHQGSAGIGGTAVDIELQAEDLRHTRDTVLDLIAQYTGQSLETITRDSQRDRWYTADQAQEYGFVDTVLADPLAIAPARPTTGLGYHR